MTPAPVAVVKSINTVVADEGIMTNEELDNAVQDVSEQIKKLPEDEKSLSKEERKHRMLLMSQKNALEKMKLAREKGDANLEAQCAVAYGMLTSWLGKYPYLLHLMFNFKSKRPLL